MFVEVHIIYFDNQRLKTARPPGTIYIYIYFFILKFIPSVEHKQKRFFYFHEKREKRFKSVFIVHNL